MSVLSGLRILNTRPLGQNKKLSKEICAAGAISIELPALVINHIKYETPDLQQIDKAIFLSVNAVACFFDCLDQKWPKSICTIAIGEATKNALEERGILVDYHPESSTSEGIVKLDVLQEISGQKILIIKGVDGLEIISQAMIDRGGEICPVSVYERSLPAIDSEQTKRLRCDDAVDIIIITSVQALKNIFILFGESSLTWLRHKPCFVISPRIAKEAGRLGMHDIIVTEYKLIIDAIRQYKLRTKS